MRIDLQSDYILVLWDGVPDWIATILQWCCNTKQPKAADTFCNQNEILPRCTNILDQYCKQSRYNSRQYQWYCQLRKLKKKEHPGVDRLRKTTWDSLRQIPPSPADSISIDIRSFFNDIQHYNALGAIKVSGQELHYYAEYKAQHPELGRECACLDNSLVMEILADRVFTQKQLKQSYYCYLEHETSLVDADFDLCSSSLLYFGGIPIRCVSLTLMPVKVIAEIDVTHTNILPILRGKHDNQLADLRSIIEDIDAVHTMTAERAEEPQAAKSCPSGKVGGNVGNPGPERRKNAPRRRLTHEQRLKKLGFKNVEIKRGTAKIEIRFFDDVHIDTIEEQFGNYLKIAEGREGNEHFQLIKSDKIDKRPGAQMTFIFEEVRYSIGLCRKDRHVRIWFKREPEQQKDRSKYANFIYIE